MLGWNELENDSDLNDDGTIVTIDQQDARGDFKIIGMPFTMSNFTTDYQRAPKLGENNEEILEVWVTAMTRSPSCFPMVSSVAMMA